MLRISVPLAVMAPRLPLGSHHAKIITLHLVTVPE
jgi:hypothetical protein